MQDNNQQQLIKDIALLEAKIQNLLGHYLALKQAHQKLQEQHTAILEQQKTAALRLEKVIGQLEYLISYQATDF
jgi:hypothetical protein